jgi:hypothetical protein
MDVGSQAFTAGNQPAGRIRRRGRSGLSMKRLSSAVGEGAMAVHFVHEYLRSSDRV